jgi:hypothetical protein
LHAWLGKLGIPIGGKSFRDVKEQADRLSRCRLTFHVQQGGRAGLINQNIVDAAMFVSDEDGRQESLFVETARLSETFFEQLKKHPVPLEDAAIKAISNCPGSPSPPVPTAQDRAGRQPRLCGLGAL